MAKRKGFEPSDSDAIRVTRLAVGRLAVQPPLQIDNREYSYQSPSKHLDALNFGVLIGKLWKTRKRQSWDGNPMTGACLSRFWLRIREYAYLSIDKLCKCWPVKGMTNLESLMKQWLWLSSFIYLSDQNFSIMFQFPFWEQTYVSLVIYCEYNT